MAKREYFKVNGSESLPPVDGTYYTDALSVDCETDVIVIACYDANGDAVVGSGSALFEACPIDGQWLSGQSEGDNPVDLALAGETATYSMPLFLGPVTRARVTFSGVTGAPDVDHIKAFVWRK